MTSFIHKKIYDFFLKDKDTDIDEIGEDYNDHIKASNETLLMVPNSKNISIIEKGFSSVKNTLLILSILCCIVYRSDSPYNEICKRWGFPENSVRTVGDQLVFGEFLIDDKLVITFKGSSSKADFLTDIDFIPMDDRFNIPGKMHRGFYKLLFETGNYQAVLRVIDMYPETIPLIVTGHSLGGGLASLFYAYLKTVRNHSPREVQLFTFGCPRTGNSTFTSFIEQTTRVTNCNDIVCRIPLPISYRHPNKEIHLGSSNFCKFSMDDHHLTEYYKNLLEMPE